MKKVKQLPPPIVASVRAGSVLGANYSEIHYPVLISFMNAEFEGKLVPHLRALQNRFSDNRAFKPSVDQEHSVLQAINLWIGNALFNEQALQPVTNAYIDKLRPTSDNLGFQWHLLISEPFEKEQKIVQNPLDIDEAASSVLSKLLKPVCSHPVLPTWTEHTQEMVKYETVNMLNPNYKPNRIDYNS